MYFNIDLLMPTKKKIIIKKKKQIIKVKQSQKVKVVVNVGTKNKTKAVRRKTAPQQKQPIIINTHVINQPAAQQYDQQQQLQQSNQQKQQNYEELLNVPPVERNKLFPEKLKQKEYFENELTSKLRQPKKIAIRQPIMPAVQENELESTGYLKYKKPIKIEVLKQAEALNYRDILNRGRQQEDKRENVQVEANLLGQLQAEPKELRKMKLSGINTKIKQQKKENEQFKINKKDMVLQLTEMGKGAIQDAENDEAAATKIQRAAINRIKYKKNEIGGAMNDMINSIVDDTNATKIAEIEDEIKKSRSRTATIREQLDVAEAKNSYLNVIKQPEENPREVDEAKPEPKKLTRKQQALNKREAKAKAKALIPAAIPEVLDEAKLEPKKLTKKQQKEAKAKALIPAAIPEVLPKKLTKREQQAQDKQAVINKQILEESNRLRTNNINVSELKNVKELQKIAKRLNIQRSVGSGKEGEKLKRQNLVVLIQGMQANIQRDINSKMGAV